MKEATCSKCGDIYNPENFGELHLANNCNGLPINEGEYKIQTTMETCLICFEDYRIGKKDEHICPDVWSCGACGELCDISEGTVAINNGLIEFTHSADICGAQDEIGETN